MNDDGWIINQPGCVGHGGWVGRGWLQKAEPVQGPRAKRDERIVIVRVCVPGEGARRRKLLESVVEPPLGDLIGQQTRRLVGEGGQVGGEIDAGLGGQGFPGQVEGKGKFGRCVPPGLIDLLLAGGGGGIEPGPGRRGELEGRGGDGDQVGGQGKVVEKGQIGVMALAADGGKVGFLVQTKAVAKGGDDRGRQPTLVDRTDRIRMEGGKPNGQVVFERTVATGIGQGCCGRSVGGLDEVRREQRREIGRDDVVLAATGLGFGRIAIEKAQIPELFGARDGGEPGLQVTGQLVFAPGSIGANTTEAVLKRANRQGAPGGEQSPQGVLGQRIELC